MGDDSTPTSPIPDDDSHSIGVKKRRFMNGWTPEVEDLIADWADKAACYRWMHDRTSRIYQGRDRYFNIPIIVLSAVIAGANFAMNSIVGDDKENQKLAQIGLGGASTLVGIIQTIMNVYKYAGLSEAHRVAGISWGKFNRLLCIEMSVNPDERMDSFAFLKMFRVELDRLIEQSPLIPDFVIKDFNQIFKHADVQKPDITGILNHTKVQKDTGKRLKRIAAEAAIQIHYRKGVLKQMVADELENRTRDVAVGAAKKVAEEILNRQKQEQQEALRKRIAKPIPFAVRQKEEREKEVTEIARRNAGIVRELTERFRSQGPDDSLLNTVEEYPQEDSVNRHPSIRRVSIQTPEEQEGLKNEFVSTHNEVVIDIAETPHDSTFATAVATEEDTESITVPADEEKITVEPEQIASPQEDTATQSETEENAEGAEGEETQGEESKKGRFFGFF